MGHLTWSVTITCLAESWPDSNWPLDLESTYWPFECGIVNPLVHGVRCVGGAVARNVVDVDLAALEATTMVSEILALGVSEFLKRSTVNVALPRDERIHFHRNTLTQRLRVRDWCKDRDGRLTSGRGCARRGMGSSVRCPTRLLSLALLPGVLMHDGARTVLLVVGGDGMLVGDLVDESGVQRLLEEVQQGVVVVARLCRDGVESGDKLSTKTVVKSLRFCDSRSTT